MDQTQSLRLLKYGALQHPEQGGTIDPTDQYNGGNGGCCHWSFLGCDMSGNLQHEDMLPRLQDLINKKTWLMPFEGYQGKGIFKEKHG